MNPIAISELLEAGLLYFRRFLSVYRAADKAVLLTESVTQFFDDELRNHRRIEGEEIYLFILAKETVDPLLKGRGFDQKMINQLITVAMIEALDNRSSNEIRTVITSFGYQLGRVFQTADDDFLYLCQDYLNNPSGDFVPVDPVYSFLERYKQEVPADVLTMVRDLGLPTHTLPAIFETLELNGMVKDWVKSIESIADRNPRLHKSASFIGMMIRGARSIITDAELSVAITSGPAGFNLSMLTLTHAEPVIHTNNQLSDVRSITREMVSDTSRKAMISRGYVQLDKGGWAKLDEADYVPEKPGDPSSTMVYRRKAASANDASTKAKEGSDRLKSMVTSSTVSFIQSKGKSVGVRLLRSLAKQMDKKRKIN